MVIAADYIPAESKLEAVSRLYALAGFAPEGLGPGSTEKKSVLTAVARSLELDVDLDSPKATLGGRMAVALGESWDSSCWSRGQTITLIGLNAILRGATREFAFRSAHSSPKLQGILAGLHLEGFFPARHKFEAVTRMAALTGAPPQTLGPGSKERKSALSNLAADLGLSVDFGLAKPDLGREMARQLHVGWDDTCWSTGSTITLDGLNSLLAGAERRLGVSGARTAEYWTPERESQAIISALLQVVTPFWDGRRSVREMCETEFSHWRQMEWPGFYFEMVGLTALIDTLGGGPVQHANTRFDYSLGSAWDLKAHARQVRSAGADRAILNDRGAFEACFAAQSSVGFVVLTGFATTSEEFGVWHREFVGTRPRSPGDYRPQRARKESFSPRALETYHLRNFEHMSQCIASGALLPHHQGRQASGALRKPKLTLDLNRARELGVRLDVAEVLRR
ncbi:hypothetical protein L6241_07480 [Janibacter sp. Y6]|uniref:hypothetical protein n=1 Tax=Janibacter sp. Y6 TaxID=2913552 RepID=UPI0034A443F2